MKNQVLTHEVLVVGAGPTGLSLAAALRKLNIDVKIVELKPGLSDTSKATNLMHGTQEQLAVYDMIKPMYEMSGKMSRMMMHGYGTNLGPRTMHLTESPYEDLLLLGQDNIERSLAESLERQGVSISFDTKLRHLTQDKTSVTVELESMGEVKTEYYKYVIACDGPWGATRTFTSCDFAPVKTGCSIRQVDAKLTWKRLQSMQQMWLFYFAAGFAVVVPLLDGYYRILTIEPTENMPDRKPTLEEVRDKLIEVTKDNSITLSEPKWFSHTELTMGIAPKLIDGRVILAGDAGNPILPNGGQGLNTGIQDSLNLAWKLASVLKGQAKEQILKTYEEERLTLRAGLEKVQFNSLKYTTRTPKFMQYMISKIGNFMLDKGGEQAMARAFGQLNISYAKSSLSIDKLKKGIVKAGNRCLDGELIKASTMVEVSLFEILAKPVWKCIFFDHGKSDSQSISTKLSGVKLKDMETLIITSTTQSTFATNNLYYDIDEVVHKRYGITEPTILLVRPDIYVAVRVGVKDWAVIQEFISKWFI